MADEKRLQAAENQQQRDQRRYEAAANFQSRFARIYCTSGLGASGSSDMSETQKSGWILDWGLADLCRTRVPTSDGLSSVRLAFLSSKRERV